MWLLLGAMIMSPRHAPAYVLPMTDGYVISSPETGNTVITNLPDMTVIQGPREPATFIYTDPQPPQVVPVIPVDPYGVE